MTCFNRKSQTLACLEAIFRNAVVRNGECRLFMLSWSTMEALTGHLRRLLAPTPQSRWFEVTVISIGAEACTGPSRKPRNISFDYLLWLNDDTLLFEDALARLLNCDVALQASSTHPRLIVGSTQDKISGILSYGGQVRSSGFRRTHFQLLENKSSQPMRCDTMTGNIVLVPADTHTLVGNLDPTFEHAMGDTDYALRAGAPRCRGLGRPRCSRYLQ
jgi:hypothetical protein